MLKILSMRRGNGNISTDEHCYKFVARPLMCTPDNGILILLIFHVPRDHWVFVKFISILVVTKMPA